MAFFYSVQYKAKVSIILLHNLNRLKLSNSIRLHLKPCETAALKLLFIGPIMGKISLRNHRRPTRPTNFPLKLKQFQFLIKVSCTITFNKAQSPTLKINRNNNSTINFPPTILCNISLF